MNKVVLFFPETHTQRNEDPWCLPPLSLLAIAAPLLQAGHDVKIVDARIDNEYVRTLLTECEGAVCLGISVLTGRQIEGALRVSREIKKHLPDLPVVWGGYHPTLLPEQTIAETAVDVVVKGQGEITFRELVEALIAGRTLAGLKGVVFKEQGRVVCNPDREFADINQFPPHPYSLVTMENHFPALEFGKRTIGYVSSQGCPHDCTFCAESAAYNKRWSSLSPQRVGQDLEGLVRQYHADGVIFVDNNFFVDEHRVQGICREIVRRKLKINWGAQGRADQIVRQSAETFALLKESGFLVFHVGAESGSDQQLEQVSKSIDRQTTLQCARVCKEYGIRISFGFIFGFPGETEADIQKNFSLMEDVTDIQGHYDCIIHFFAPSPGAEVLSTSVGLEIDQPARLDDWISYNTARGSMTPWIDEKYIDRIKRRHEYFYPFAKPGSVFVDRVRGRTRGMFFFNLLHLITAVRYRFHLYSFPVDWWLYKGFKYFRGRFAARRTPSRGERIERVR